MLGVIPGPGLLFGLMLVAAIVGGYLARLVHVPRVIGFLLGGVALKEVIYAIFSPDGGGQEREALEAAVQPLHVIKDLALGLILFTIGGVFERSKLRALSSKVLTISALEVGLVALFVFVGCTLVALLTQSSHGIGQNLVLALLLGVAAVATAPAATLFVLQEYEAKGAVTDTILGLTGINNIVCIIVFYSVFLVLASLGVIEARGSLAEHLWTALAWTTFGSLALGVLAGVVISMLHAKLPLSETLLFFFALFILLGGGEHWFWERFGASFNFLLTTLVMGAVFANVAIDSQKLTAALRTVGLPIFVSFFVMAGYELHIRELAHMGWLGAAYVLCRYLGKVYGCRLGVKRTGLAERAGGRLGTALLCQAAVVIGLASFVERNWTSDLAETFSMIVLGSVVAFELAGPLLVKRCAVQAGEVKAITLLSRAGVFTEGTSIFRLTLRSLGRLIGVNDKDVTPSLDEVRVEHIMRTNVQFIHASATFDEVLHSIERSTYSHFPVVDEDGGFVGVIHFSDVRDVIYDPALSGLVTAVDLADPESATVSADVTLPDLLNVFTSQNVGVLPVVDQPGGTRVVGIVEQRDLLRALHQPQ